MTMTSFLLSSLLLFVVKTRINHVSLLCMVEKRECPSMQTILGDSMDEESFFRNVWQIKPMVFPKSNKSNDSPLAELFRCGWESSVGLLEQARFRLEDSPLLFLRRQFVDAQSRYGGSLFHAYLDGCSVVINHADRTCPYIAKLCLDLQDDGVFPHAYANTYLTPPSSQAVKPHADDRDVFVLQVGGKKRWFVYEQVPIAYPYTHEQVGKHGLAVPQTVLEGNKALDVWLEEGDVLYIPRGHVHEASTAHDAGSFHVTVALATHDWSLASVLTSALWMQLNQHDAYRQALPLTLGRSFPADPQDTQTLQTLLQQALRDMTTTTQDMEEQLRLKHTQHNQQSLALRQKCLLRHKIKEASEEEEGTKEVVGTEASQHVTLDSWVRASTGPEKALLAGQPKDFRVRADTSDAVIEVIRFVKANPNVRIRVGDLSQHTAIAVPDELTWLAVAKHCVELGAFAIASL